MRYGVVLACAGLLVFGAVVEGAGCSGSTSRAPPAGAAGGAAGAGGTSGASACVHRTTDSVSRRDSDVLPTGACQPGTPVCDLIVRDPCPCLGTQVPRKFYACNCAGGTWQCKLKWQDAGYCSALMPGCYTEGGCTNGDAGGDVFVCDGGVDASQG